MAPERLLGPLLATSIQAQGRYGIERPESLAMHAAIYDAIAGRDVTRARAALDKILDQAATEVEKLIDERRAKRPAA